jgi:hypothetical protein
MAIAGPDTLASDQRYPSGFIHPCRRQPASNVLLRRTTITINRRCCNLESLLSGFGVVERRVRNGALIG